jgi:hypothetical protein
MTDEGKPSRWEDLTFDKDGRLIDLNGPVEFATFGPPPPITWIPVMDVADAFGRRAATRNSRGPIYDLRIASQVFEDSGGWYVHLVGEDQWWDWLAIPVLSRPERPGKAVCWPTRYVWIEHRETGEDRQ